MTEQPQSRINIAFTSAGEEAARRVLVRLPIGTLADVARVAIAFALREGTPAERPTDFGIANGANYNVGSIDPSGELRSAVRALRPDHDGDPNRVLETFMTVGALAIDAKVSTGEVLSVKDLLSVVAAGADTLDAEAGS